MDWQRCMNRAIDYIEDNLSDEIDYSVAARCMNCSVWEFRRIFSFMAGMPLSDYIRNRRLTLAAHDIQVKRDRIIDVAMRYGYDTPASFSRAFSQLHGSAPKSARDEGVMLKSFPRLSFQIILKGVEAMDYRIEKKETFQFIGRRRRVTTVNDAHYGAIGSFWHEFNNGDLCRILNEKYSSDQENWVMDVSTPTANTDEFDYTIGVPYNGAANEDGLDVVTVPGGTYVIFDIPDEYKDNIGKFMHRVMTEHIPALGYELAGVDAEYFADGKAQAWFLVK